MPTWVQHWDIVQLSVGLLFSGFLFLLVRTLKKIDANQTELFNQVNQLKKDFYELRGEHNALSGHHRRSDDQ